MTFNGDVLVVADVDCLRMYDRGTGRQIGASCVYGSTSLVAAALGADGRLYATEAGLRHGPDRPLPTGGDAIYLLDPEEGPVRLVEGAELGRPGGLAADAAGLLTATTDGDRVLRIGYDGSVTTVATVPAAGLTGLVLRPDGTLLVSATAATVAAAGDAGSAGAAVFRVDPASGAVEPLVEPLGATGLIGYDPGRDVVAIPVPGRGSVVFRALGSR
jgi:sugar lactone lactonase YvrE